MASIEQLRQIKIDEEFETVCPPLTEDEINRLEANILADGAVTSPLIVWGGVLLDGHNRRKIVFKHPDLSFAIREMSFSNRYDAMAWICKNQLGRRNLTDSLRDYLIGIQYRAEKKSHGSTDGFRGNRYKVLVSGQNDQILKTKGTETRDRLAKENGISASGVQRNERFANGVDAAEAVLPGIKEGILSGAVKATKAEVAAIAKAPAEERKQLVEDLMKPKDTTQKKPKEAKPEQAKSETTTIPMEENDLPLSAAEDAKRMSRVGADSVIQIIAAGFGQARKSCESYIAEYPELLTAKKPEFRKALQEFTDYYTKLLKTIGGIE